MRHRLVCALAGLCVLLSACKDKGGEAPAGSAAVVEDDSAAKAAQDLLARRDALMKSRQKLQDERQELEAERSRLIESGGDTSEVDRKLEEHRTQEAQIVSQESAVGDEMRAFLETAKNLKTSADVQERAAAREQHAASREESVKQRESEVAKREADLARREATLAERERNTCGVAAAPVYVPAPVKGEKYSKRDVEPLLKKAREAMSKKGILSSDLPAQAAGLEREAARSMGEGDYGPARFAAQQLLATVEAQKIDRNFIAAKISRLSKAMSGKKLDDGKRQEVEDLFADATAKYGDGDYAGANKKLNQIWRTID